MSEKREDYVNNLKAKIQELNQEISKLSDKAGQAKEEKKAEYKEQMDKLREKRKDLESKVSEMKEASESTWEKFKEGVESSWEALKEKTAEVKSRFKKDAEKEEKK